jgi:hypothetical protein
MIDPSIVLETLTSSPPVRLHDLPSLNGIYALRDHCGEIRYIGVTGKNDKGFRGRVNNRHVTGSEGRSHKFSHAYNTGRMWRSRDGHPLQILADAVAAKTLRTQFIRRHCRATYFVIEREGLDPLTFFRRLQDLEALVQEAAPPPMRSWEGKDFSPVEEPKILVDAILKDLRWSPWDRMAVDRQAALFAACRSKPVVEPA